MCGIVGFAGSEGRYEPQDIIIEGLKKLEYRGYDSAGVAIVNGGRIELRKKVGPIVNLERMIAGERLGGNVGIGHTRWATHGAPSDLNAHPHINEDGTVAIVHNGTIENYVELRQKLVDEDRIKFRTDTDSEVSAMLISKYYKQTGDLKEAMDLAVSDMEGTFALAAIAADKNDELVAYRMNAPLIVGKGEGFNMVASDFAAVVKLTKDVYLLENGDTVVVKADSVTIYDEDNRKADRELMHIDWDVDAAEKGDYDHFMIKEINEQSAGIMETLNRSIDDNGNVKLYGIDFTKEQLDRYNKIYIVACGTAYHAGLVGRYVIEKFTRIPVEVDIASEFRYRDPFVDDKTLFIAISQSGETADTLMALREAKDKGAHILSIVNVVGSSVARESDDVFYTWAGPEIAVASTKAYTTQLVCLYLIAIYFARLRGTVEAEFYDDFISELVAMPGRLEEVLEQDQYIKELAEEYYDREQVFYIGRGVDSAVAYEGSLKLKEVSYVNSFAIAAGELKHGTIALMEPQTIVFALATQDRLFDKMVSNIQEVKARKSHVISIAKEGRASIEEHSDEVIYIPRCMDELTPLLSVVPLQLYAYYVARERHCEIDRPRNLAKSVTVE